MRSMRQTSSFPQNESTVVVLCMVLEQLESMLDEKSHTMFQHIVWGAGPVDAFRSRPCCTGGSL
eukprot:4490608-Amphidinium_carterae.2